MFTGIIETLGQVRSVTAGTASAVIEIAVRLQDDDLKIGDSVAVNGVCLTVTSRTPDLIRVDVGQETLNRTTIGSLKRAETVNIERPLKFNGRLGGHLVQGHVDGVGKILKINKIDGGLNVELEADNDVMRYLITKGSVAINGTSLTINRCLERSFSVFLIPHTIESTIFKYAKVGDLVNLEIDIIGKYVEKLSHADFGKRGCASTITEDLLRTNGF